MDEKQQAKFIAQLDEDDKKDAQDIHDEHKKEAKSTLILLENIHVALTRGRGKEILIISQSKDKAKDHLQDIRKMILNSPVYADCLIDNPKSDEEFLRD